MIPCGDDQTEQPNVATQCGGDVDALTLAVPPSHTVVGAISADHHGCSKKLKKVLACVGFWPWYDFCVGLRREVSDRKNSA